MSGFWKNRDKRKKAINDAKESLRDIVPVRDKLRRIKEGDRSLEELLSDSTFEAEIEKELGYKPSDEEKEEIIRKAINEFDLD